MSHVLYAIQCPGMCYATCVQAPALFYLFCEIVLIYRYLLVSRIMLIHCCTACSASGFHLCSGEAGLVVTPLYGYFLAVYFFNRM